MDKLTKYWGYVAFGAMAYFLYRTTKSGTSMKAPIQGLNIDVNPGKIIDSVMPWTPIPDEYKAPVSSSIKRMVEGYISEKQIIKG